MSRDRYESSRHSAAPITMFLFQGASGGIGPFAYCNGDEPFIRDGITYEPWPIKHGNISQSVGLDKSDLDITLALGSQLDDLFVAYPPSEVINLIIYEGNIGDDPIPQNYPAVWVGRTSGATYKGREIVINCAPVSTSILRPGLRRNYQVSCPHVLYGEQCKASKAAGSRNAVVSSTAGRKIIFNSPLPFGARYAGGLMEWIDPATGWREMRTIIRSEQLLGGAGTEMTIRGIPKGLVAGRTVTVSIGCDRLMSGCKLHNNIKNYGGQPYMPRENPLSQKNQFY